jgi:hypothetical protein
MLPVIEGVIRRRLLLIFRMDPDLVAPLLPEPLEVLTHRRFAIVGICLIGMERLRPKGFQVGLDLRPKTWPTASPSFIRLAQVCLTGYSSGGGTRTIASLVCSVAGCFLVSIKKALHSPLMSARTASRSASEPTMERPMFVLRPRMGLNGTRNRSFLA